MDRKILKDAMISHCKNLPRSISEREIKTILPLSPKEIDQLKKGSGNAEKEYLFADSSTALGVNYFSLYKECHEECKIEYEWKKESPLIVGGNSNLDIWLKEGNIIKFYESKFLEPYYMSNSDFTAAYFDPVYYTVNRELAQTIINMIRCKECNYYNVSQLVRHLLAIYNHINKHPEEYSGIDEVILISICWEMPDGFIKSMANVTKRSISYLKKRIDVLLEERIKAESYINQFIDLLQPELGKKLDIKLSFKTDSYNRAITALRDSEYLNSFKEQYFL